MGHGNYIDPFGGFVISGGAEGEVGKSFTVQAGEHKEIRSIVLPGESREVRVDVDLVGEGAGLDMKGLYLCPADERVSFRILVHHRVPGCVSRQLFKGIAGGTAHVVFDGTILVAPDAQRTEAYQESHSLLLSETAVAETRPQLEIYADDVKCSHGATVGRLDPAERFYMRSRGIPEKEAEYLQMLSFLSPVLEGLSAEERSRVEEALSQMLA